ncbi:Uncharacterized protein YR821_0620 [Yersinia ruckeri]|uniref:Uncharacterized protein n=1 Tax=Yersinia ruckeri TaxID=29486 RepID=A0A0A8VEN5_YERRU|nr:hypothetical protein yruck0001_23990 [Yersinia ruckeri ATCC 29473]QTD75552.1 Uncharacterized protein YR821_0620 [Yersinia ruckeri]CEK26449.1 hypothetical protein CSF007_3350 [Yersinia ruckeri]
MVIMTGVTMTDSACWNRSLAASRRISVDYAVLNDSAKI